MLLWPQLPHHMNEKGGETTDLFLLEFILDGGSQPGCRALVSGIGRMAIAQS